MPEHQNLSRFAGGSLQARNLERGFNPRLSSRIRHHLSELHPRRYRMMARTKSQEEDGWVFKGANYFKSYRMLSDPALFCRGMDYPSRHRTPHTRRILLRLRRKQLNMNREERKWKKLP